MLALLLLTLAQPAPTQTAPVDPQAEIAPVVRAIAAERARQAALAPPADDRERLIRLGRLDQAPRMALRFVDFSRLSPAGRAALNKVVFASDAEHAAAVLSMLPPEGWFLKSRYGPEASEAAFHIIQHSNKALLRRFVPVLEPLVARGEVDGLSYAKMYDRLQTSEGRPQRFGTQYRCAAGRNVPFPIEDQAQLEARRRSVGIDWSHAEEAARVAGPC